MKLDNSQLKKSLLLYAVTDRSWTGEKSLFEQVEETVKAGTTFVQLREKNISYDEFMNEAELIKKICAEYNVPFVINDNVALAKEVDADGVHIGQDDMSITEARAIIGNDKILGVSVQTVKDAILAEQMGADYLGVGAVFPTNSKSDAVDVSYDTLKAICSSVKIPVVAIGGINKSNIKNLTKSGICGIAVISAIFAEKN
ncbi:MAG: thiamine phosphate synthase, partial [Treponema sp.]|nr:thiamine phosphate synthase [Treponema sp.]